MTTDPITRLNAALEGRYSIKRELGEGGMATVYLAEDLRHERKVALKVLKPELAAVVGAERFLTEIKTTANLQHPHILPLFDSGQAESFLYYVMPYVEGDTLSDKIDREKQLGIEEALKITEKVASALEHAHKHGVVHRDIKPGNILLNPEGEPTVADFGIALAVAQAGGGRVTETGLSVGTPHYMSPEQATGDRDVDPRTDVYALGSVLYEMLTGEPPYQGGTAQAVLARILTDPPPTPTKVRVSIPPNVEAAIRKALEKLPADRFASAQEFARALGDPAFRHGEEVADRGLVAMRQLTPLAIGLAAIAVVFALGLGWSLLQPEPNPQVLRVEVPVQAEVEVAANGVSLAVSPDGSRIVFVGISDGVTQLWQRPLSQLSAVAVPGTDGAVQPRFSPDGESVVYGLLDGRLRTVSLDGATPQTLVPDAAAFDHAWGPDGSIYFGRPGLGIRRVPEGGGEEEEVTRLVGTETGHHYPDVLPNAEGVLFTRISPDEASQIAVVRLSTGRIQVLLEGRVARYAASGHLVVASGDGRLSAAPFDLERLELSGPVRSLGEDVLVGGRADPEFALSQSGQLAYLPGEGRPTAELVWVTRSGESTPVDPGWRFLHSRGNFAWRLSPDEARVAVQVTEEGNTDIWIKQLPDGPFERLTLAEGDERYPAWTPDGEAVTYAAGPASRGGIMAMGNMPGHWSIWERRADGAGTAELVLERVDDRPLLQVRWSPDGEWIVFRTGGLAGVREGRRDVLGFRPGEDSTAVPLVATEEFAEYAPAVSPDGRWLAYTSNRSGRAEVYVEPFPDVGLNRTQVSVNGGNAAVWAHSGDELFFITGDRRMVAAESRGSLSSGWSTGRSSSQSDQNTWKGGARTSTTCRRMVNDS